jgi:hypothetical protein
MALPCPGGPSAHDSTDYGKAQRDEARERMLGAGLGAGEELRPRSAAILAAAAVGASAPQDERPRFTGPLSWSGRRESNPHHQLGRQAPDSGVCLSSDATIRVRRT